MNESDGCLWYEMDDETEAAESIVGLVSTLAANDSGRRDFYNAMGRLYRDKAISGSWDHLRGDRLQRWPALRSGISATHSRIAKSHPAPRAITEDGPREAQKRAESQTTWWEGQFERCDVYPKGERAFGMMLKYGTGIVQVFDDEDDEIAVEVVKPWHLFVDPLEEEYDAVRSIYRVRFIDRKRLLAAFPDSAEAIKAADKFTDLEILASFGITADKTGSSDIVMAVEGWRLPSGNKHPGRHTIAIDGCALLHEAWEDDCFPFAIMRWDVDDSSFWGIGLAEQMAGSQAELNDRAKKASDSAHFFVPSAWIDAAGEITATQITNGAGKIYTYVGSGGHPPILFDPTPCLLAMQQAVDIEVRRTYEFAGISQLSSQSQKPAGLNSGKALNTFQDIESERFAIASREYERFYIQIAKIMLKVADRILKRNPKAKLEAQGGREALRTVSYADAKMGKWPFTIRVLPTSGLSNTFSAKIEEVTTMVDRGWVDDMEGRQLLELPDIKRSNNIKLARRKYVHKIVDRVLDTGEQTAISAYVDLGYMIEYGNAQVNLASCDETVPEDNLSGLRAMIEMAIEEQAKLAPPPPPPGAPMTPPMPGGGAEMPALPLAG